jgi:putative membrane protein
MPSITSGTSLERFRRANRQTASDVIPRGTFSRNGRAKPAPIGACLDSRGVGWTLDPFGLACLALGAALLVRRGRRLVAAGLLLALVALVSPLATIGAHRLFCVHMAQHLVIGDIAPLVVALGLPVRRPLVPLAAVAVWAGDLWLWHVPLLYDAALRHPALHALEHAAFFACGLALWSSLLRAAAGPTARLAGLGVVMLNGVVLANLFLWSGGTWYGFYERAPRTWGLSHLADQRAGGGVMLAEMMAVGLAAFVLIGLDWLALDGAEV